MGIIRIDNTQTALLEKQGLALQIFLKRCMLIWSDMIRFDIGKDADIKGKTIHTMHHKSLGRYFHDRIITAGIQHLAEKLLHHIGFRCRIIGRDLFIPDDGFDGTDQTNFKTCIFHDGLDHVGGRRLSLGSCDTDDL